MYNHEMPKRCAFRWDFRKMFVFTAGFYYQKNNCVGLAFDACSDSPLCASSPRTLAFWNNNRLCV